MLTGNEPLTIAETAALIRGKKLSPVELIEHVIERIAKYEPKLNAFITIMRDEARIQAAVAEKEIMSGGYKGPLHGIPISLKDAIAYANVPLTNGSRFDPDYIPPNHATVTRKLLDAGAIVAGKAHLYEYAFGIPHPYYGWSRNPWEPGSIPGGSSSGSGVSVQAGFVLGSIGTDTAGSIRNPSSLCGIVGLKPTYGLVSRHGVTPVSWTLDHVGPMARTCEDAALILQAIAGHDPKDQTSLKIQSWDFRSFRKLDSLHGVRLGIPSSYFFEDIDPDVETAVQRAIGVLESSGAELIPVDIEAMPEIRTANWVILNSEAYTLHRRNLELQGEAYGSKLRHELERGQFFSAETYIQSLRYRNQALERFKQLFAKVDALVTPSTPLAAQSIELYLQHRTSPYGKFLAFANYLGLPAVSIPAGFTSHGLPVGLQLAGPAYSEGSLLSIGHLYEKWTAWYKHLPQI